MKKCLLLILLSILLFMQAIDVKAAERTIEDQKPAVAESISFSCDHYPNAYYNNGNCESSVQSEYRYAATEVFEQEEFMVPVTVSYTCSEFNPNTGLEEFLTCYRQEYQAEYRDVFVGYQCPSSATLMGNECVEYYTETRTYPAETIVNSYSCAQYDGYELVGNQCIKYSDNVEPTSNDDTTDDVVGEVRITDVELVDSSVGTQIIAEPTVDEWNLSFNLSFESTENFAKYVVTIKNNSSKDYKVSNKSPLNSNFIKYDVTFDDGSDIVKPNSEKK